MMYDSEVLGVGVTSHGGGESLYGASAKQPLTDTQNALKSAEENKSCCQQMLKELTL